MEHKIGQLIPHRLPKIPRPRHKVRGYRYLEEENSDESGSEKEEEEEGGSSEGEVGGEEPDDPQEPPRCQNRCAYEQAQEEDNVG